LLEYENPGELLAVIPPSILTHTHPEDLPILDFTPAPDAQPMHLRLRNKTGDWVWVALGMQTVDGPEGPQRVAFVQDMTLSRQQREASARLASVVDAADEAIIGTDLRGVVSDWNQGATRLFGYSTDEAVGRPLADFLIPPDQQEEHQRVMDAMANGESVPRFETVRLCKEKKLIHTSVTVNPIFAGEGELVGSTIVEHDITQARMSAAARQAKELEDAEVMKLKGLERIRKTFMSEASHELNTPLTPLRIHVEALSEAKDLSPDTRAHLQVIERNLLRLCNLVRDMLEASRLETGRFKLDIRDTAVATLLEEVTQGLAETAKRGRVKLEVDLPKRLVAKVDSDRIGQVLYNLLTNAISFTKEGGHVNVSARAEENFVIVRVRDTGVGLSPGQITQLFQPFARPHEGTGSAPKGTGLGLFISKGIIEQHGGQIWAESPGPGAGSSFCFTLPSGRMEPRSPISVDGPHTVARPTTRANPPVARAPHLRTPLSARSVANVLVTEDRTPDVTN
ncbi:MAG TPA: ATP-binding protein, partial [Candidatus Thermoplasmatota archaeon]